RHGIARAPMLDARTRAALIALARARFYRDRSWDALIRDARAAGLPRRQIDRFAAWPKPDRKAADARLLLRRLAATPGDRRPAAPIRVPRTWALRQLEDWLAGGRQ
ncbi:MAG TPA: hypothetical protein VFT22_29225, partial [Kofleriaceae bacterium]|nr:hypothetical protein [Kofleriaceae bacterium]